MSRSNIVALTAVFALIALARPSVAADLTCPKASAIKRWGDSPDMAIYRAGDGNEGWNGAMPRSGGDLDLSTLSLKVALIANERAAVACDYYDASQRVLRMTLKTSGHASPVNAAAWDGDACGGIEMTKCAFRR